MAPVTATFTRSGYDVRVVALPTSTAAVSLLDQSQSDFRRGGGASFWRTLLKGSSLDQLPSITRLLNTSELSLFIVCFRRSSNGRSYLHPQVTLSREVVSRSRLRQHPEHGAVAATGATAFLATFSSRAVERAVFQHQCCIGPRSVGFPALEHVEQTPAIALSGGLQFEDYQMILAVS